MERRGLGILRLGELVDDVDELGDAPRPAVGQNERGGIRPRRTPAEEMDAEPVDDRAELADLVQPSLERPPVMGRWMSLDQLHRRDPYKQLLDSDGFESNVDDGLGPLSRGRKHRSFAKVGMA